jgi:hypothetical protein
MSASFSGSFKAHDAIQVMLSSAFHSGASICPDEAAEVLLSAFPDCELSRFELASAIIEGALAAEITVTGSAKR